MIGNSQSVVLTQKKSAEKIIRFIKEDLFNLLRARSHINIVEFYGKNGCQEKYNKVEISFEEKNRHIWSQKECIIPIDIEDKMIIINNKDCYVTFNWRNNNRKTLFMIVKSVQ